MSTVRKLMVVWKFMMMESRRFVDCYRVAITSERKRNKIGVQYSHTLCFWCLDPKVAFAYLGAVCRTIVVASGTETKSCTSESTTCFLRLQLPLLLTLSLPLLQERVSPTHCISLVALSIARAICHRHAVAAAVVCL